MQAVFDVVLPVFGIIFAGWARGWARVLGQDSSEALNRYVYWVALPALLLLVGGSRAVEAGWPTLLEFMGQPALTFVLARAFGLDAQWSFAAALLSGLPTGALSFVLAQQYGIYVVRASAVILASTVLSAITLSLMMALMAP